jgi:bifunctional UDP-N-acetylglucosamine pyrophosphorylase/glucosamine-1-phosphate N-acetyltransferase
MENLTVLILASGEGKRMRSRMTKSLHPLCGRPLITYPLRQAKTLAERVVMVVGPHAEGLRAVARDGVTLVEQRERLGTGHAVLQARATCPASGPLLVLPGDMPLLFLQTLERLVEHQRATRAAATVLTAVVERPHGYGRVLRLGGRVSRIVEERDATDDQRQVNEINTSVYCFDAGQLWPTLNQIKPDNDQGELYLTDVIGLLARAGAEVEALSVADHSEAWGVNDRSQMAAAATILRRRILNRLMAEGVTIIDPATTFIEDTVKIGIDTTIHQHVTIQGTTVIGDDCIVGPASTVSNSKIGNRVTIPAGSVLEDDFIADDSAARGRNMSVDPPTEIRESLKRFRREYPRGEQVAFIMMRYGTTPAHEEISLGIKQELRAHNLIGLRADDKEYHPDLLLNILTLIYGCGFGVAVFDRLLSDDFNPNVALEVGYMMALHKPLCLLKDKRLSPYTPT